MATRIKSSQIADGAIVAADLHSAIAINTTQSGTFGSLTSNGLLTLAEANILINDGSGNDNERHVRLQNSSVTAIIGIEGSVANRFVGSAANNMFLGTTTTDGIQFATSNTVRATIDSSGDTSLLGALDVTGLSTLAGNLTLDSLNPRIDFSGDDSIIYRVSVDEANNRLTLGHSTNRSLYLSNTGNATFNYDVTIEGNLVVEGTTVTLNTADLNVEDKNITLNYHATADTSSTADGAGITIQDAVDASNNATILWDATNSTFDFSHGADFAAGINTPGVIVETSGGLDVRMGTDKRVIWQGNIGEIGDVAGFQATNTAGSANEAFGIRATDIRFATGSAERVRITDTGVAINKAGTDPSQALDITGNARVHSAGYPYLEMGVSNSNYFRVVHDNPNDSLVIQKASLTGNIMTFHGTTGTGVTVGDTTNHKDFTVFGDIKNENNLPTIKPTLNYDFARTKKLDGRIKSSRSSTALYYDGKSSSIDGENLLKRSDTFFAGGWNRSGYTVTENVTTAPDGTNTGIRLSPNNSGAGTSIAVTSDVSKTTDAYVWSLYAKIDHSDYPALSLYWNSSGSANVRFDLTNGTVTSTNNGNGSITGQIYAVGNGWYRCVSVYSGATSSAATVYVLDSTGSSDWSLDNSPDGVKGMFVWGPQIERRSTASAYAPATGGVVMNSQAKLTSAPLHIPRFDHDTLTNESKGYYIEVGRTNLITNSSMAGTLDNNFAGYTEAGTAPDGTECKVFVGSMGGNAQYYISQQFSHTAGVRYAFSIFLKAYGSEKDISIYSNSVGFGPAVMYTLTGDGSDNGGAFGANASSANETGIEHFGNGWYRVWFSATAQTTNTTPFYIGINTLSTQAGDFNNKFGVWGMQVEEGYYPTSYIPTTSSTVYRAPDQIEINGQDFADFYNPYEGSWLAVEDVRYMNVANSTNRVDTLHIESSGQTNDYHVGVNSVGGSDVIYLYTQEMGVNQASLTRPISGSRDHKWAFRYAPNNFALAVRGSSINVDTTAMPSTVDKMFIGGRSAFGQMQNGRISKLAYYRKALSNENLEALVED
jgi:hypothetical protein